MKVRTTQSTFLILRRVTINLTLSNENLTSPVPDEIFYSTSLSHPWCHLHTHQMSFLYAWRRQNSDLAETVAVKRDDSKGPH